MPRPPTRPATRQISGSTTVPAPTGGLNAISPISNMAETDAIIMRNFFPEPFGCRVRKGYKQHATGLDGAVDSILTYNGQDGTTKLFAVDQSHVMDVTAPGDYSAATPVCTSANPWWQHTNFSTPAGTQMIAFNGVDDGILWSSDGLHRLVAGDGTTEYTWKDVDPQDLVVPVVYQRRLWAVEVKSTKAWYLPGECAIYKGNDPDSTDSWGLVGLFYTGSTFTRRCAVRFGGDVAILTQYGLITVGSMAKPTEYSVLDNALSQKVQYLISEVISEGSYRSGWAVVFDPSINMMLINVPGIVPSQTFQLAYNTLTKAWSIFEGQIAYCWYTVFDSILFGGDGILYRAWEGNLDDVPLDGEGGTLITAQAQQAFSYFKLPGELKHYKMFRPTFLYSGKFDYQAGANMNFDFATLPPPAAFNTSNFGVWNTSLWGDDVWAGGSQSDKQWVSIVGIGYAAAIRIIVKTGSDLTWVSTDWLMEKGGVV
jgi:hypothetical protein